MILAWLLHAVYTTVLAYGLSTTFGGLSPTVAIISLIGGTIFGWRHARALHKIYPDLRLKAFSPGQAGVIELALTVFIVYACGRHFMWMLYPADASLNSLSLNNFGDLPMHVNYIKSFANGLKFPPVNPSYAMEPLRYPLGVDLYDAVWEVLGLRMAAHLFLVGILSTLASLILLRKYAGWWGIGAFFLNGGIATIAALSSSSIDPQSGLEWKNLLLSVFITQRGMLFALPVGLLILIAVRDHLSGAKVLDGGRKTLIGLLWGFIPLFHLHAFVAISLILAGVAFEYGRATGIAKFLLSRITLVAFFPATSFILYSTGFLQKAGVAHIDWLWTWDPEKMSFAQFMITNFGLWLLVPVAIGVSLWAKGGPWPKEERDRMAIELMWQFALWVIFFNVMLAPWGWDNIKVLIWPYLGFARLANQTLEKRIGHLWEPVERPVFATALFLAGFISVISSIRAPERKAVGIYNRGELANTEGAIQDVPLAAVFAAAPTHNHPLTYFGRLRALGYEGHLWSHGINATETAAKQNKIMKGEEGWLEAARSLGVTHIFWGPAEREKYGEGERPWMTVLSNVSRVPDYAIYAVK